MIISIASFVRKIANKMTYAEVVAKQIKDYFRMGLKKEITEGLNVKNLLLRGVGDLDDEEARVVLDEFGWYFLTGKYSDPKYMMEDKMEELENKIEGLEVSDRLWREGMGKDIENRLRVQMKELLSSKRLAEPSEFRVIIDQILLKDAGITEKKNERIFNKIKNNIEAILAKEITNKLNNIRATVMKIMKEKAPLETIEPGPGDWERGISKEKVDSAVLNQDWFDLDEINSWVEKVFSDPEKMVYFNAISKEPLSDAKMIDEIKKEIGKEMSRPNIQIMKKKVLERVREKFFMGTGLKRKEKEEITDKGLHDLSPADLSDFEDFVESEMTKPVEGRGKARTPEMVARVKKVLKELASKDEKDRALKVIAEKIGVPLQAIKDISSDVIKPMFDKWQKESKEASIERLRAACMNPEAVRKMMAGLGGRRVDFEELEILNLLDRMAAVTTNYDKPKEPISPVKEKDKKPSEEDESGLGDVVEKGVKDKEKVREQFQKMVERRLLKTHKEEDVRHYEAVVEFHSKFDWKDVGEGKFHPEYDPDEGFTKDDPEFAWVSYNAIIDTTHNPIRAGKTELVIKYHFKQKLHDNGSEDGAPISSLIVERDGVETINEHGAVFFRGFLDDYFTKLRAHGLPIENTDFPVEYKNSKLGRTYHGTAKFRKMMSGFAVSDSFHREKANRYKEFMLQKDKYELGSGGARGVYDVDEMKNNLKAIMKKPQVSSVDKVEAQKMLDLVKVKGIDEKRLKDVSRFIDKHYETERDLHKDVNVFDVQ